MKHARPQSNVSSKDRPAPLSAPPPTDMEGMYACARCTREWSSRLAAADCEEQDAYEDDDRKHGRLFGIHRGLE